MRPNSQRSKNAIIGLSVAMIAAALMLVTEVFTILVYTEMIQFDYSWFDSFDLIVRIIGIIYLGSWVACAIVFIQWFRRAYFNLHTIVPSTQLRYSEGWAAGAWWIPVFNLFGPYQIATDMFKKSEKLLVDNNLMNQRPVLHTVAGWWWGLWVTQYVLSNISNRMESSYEIIMLGVVLSIIGSLAIIGAGYFAIQMIKNYSQMEELLKQIPAEGGGGSTMLITNDDLLDSGI